MLESKRAVPFVKKGCTEFSTAAVDVVAVFDS